MVLETCIPVEIIVLQQIYYIMYVKYKIKDLNDNIKNAKDN
jgi:hypothetical protein